MGLGGVGGNSGFGLRMLVCVYGGFGIAWECWWACGVVWKERRMVDVLLRMVMGLAVLDDA